MRGGLSEWSKFASAELPASESDLTNGVSIPSERACVHGCGDDEPDGTIRKKVVTRIRVEFCTFKQTGRRETAARLRKELSGSLDYLWSEGFTPFLNPLKL